MRLSVPSKRSDRPLSCSALARSLLLILCALMLTACSKSVVSGSVDVPPLSQTAQKGGTITPWPQERLTPQNTPSVVARLRQSEVANARAANACKAEYGNLQKLLVEEP